MQVCKSNRLTASTIIVNMIMIMCHELTNLNTQRLCVILLFAVFLRVARSRVRWHLAIDLTIAWFLSAIGWCFERYSLAL